jgi:phosphatidylinositol transfer protein SFH5
LSVEEATKQFIATLKWRAEFRPEDTLNETFPDDAFDGLGYVFGKDREGRPITHVIH